MSSSGPEVVELAASAGLILDPWQGLSLDVIHAEREDGNWAAFETGELVPRQNGKGGIIEAIGLAALFLFEDPLTAYSAHLFNTATQHFLRLMELIENTDDLRKRCKTPRKSHGEEGFETLRGCQLLFIARSRKSIRGFTGRRLLLDESQELSRQTMGAVLPIMTTQPRAQAHYFGTVPAPENAVSDQWEFLRGRGLTGDDPQLAWIEWSAQRDDGAAGPVPVDLDDEAKWVQANPALGIRITREALARDRLAMADDVFAREHLSLWESGSTSSPLDADKWRGLEDPGSRPGEVLAFGVAVPPDRQSAWIGVAGRRPDGVMHVELVSCCKLHARGGGWCAGLGWVPRRVAQLDARWEPNGFLLDPGSPAGALIVGIAKEHVEPVLVTGREYAQACGEFYDLFDGGELRHLGQPELNAAVGGTRWRKLGDAQAWGWADASMNIAPLSAVTLAVHGAEKKPKRKRKTGRAMSV